jgi:hypothetical protein
MDTVVGAADGVAGKEDAGALGAPLPVLLFLSHGGRDERLMREG